MIEEHSDPYASWHGDKQAPISEGEWHHAQEIFSQLEYLFEAEEKANWAVLRIGELGERWAKLKEDYRALKERLRHDF